MQRAPVRFACRSCQAEFGVVIPIPQNALFGETFMVTDDMGQDLWSKAPSVELPKAPTSATVRAPIRAQVKLDHEPFLGFESRWKMVLADIENDEPKEEFFQLCWKNAALPQAAAKFVALGSVLPVHSGVQKYIERCQGAALAAFESEAESEISLPVVARVSRPLVLLICLAAGFVFGFSIFVARLRVVALVSVLLAMVAVGLFVIAQPKLNVRIWRWLRNL